MSEECSVDVLLLNHDPPEELAECICQDVEESSAGYFFFRDLLSLECFAMVIACIILTIMDKALKLYIFFDFWVQVLLLFSSEFGLYGVVHLIFFAEDYDFWESVPWYSRVYWALFSAALPSTILSCILFWSKVFKKNIHIIHVVMNVLSPILAIFEFFLISFPLRLLHVFFFIIFYVIYVCFTVAYQKLGGTGVDGSDPIYSIVDWERPKKAILSCFIGLVIGVCSYFLFCFLSMAKIAIKQRSEYY